MKENPYQAPVEDLSVPEDAGSLEEKLRRYRRARSRWSAGCWLVGGLLGLLGLAGLVGRKFLVPNSGSMLTIVDSLSIALILLGVAVFVLGPHFWFWFRRGV